MRKSLLFLMFALLVIVGCVDNGSRVIDLSGEWQFSMDPEDIGEKEMWFSSTLSESVILPGSMVTNGKGDVITLDTEWTGGIQQPNWAEDPEYKPYVDKSNVRFPFWLQPDRKYTGLAWYQRVVEIPESWSESDIVLNLERCHWTTQVWVNSVKIGKQNSLSTAHRYDITKALTSGANTITVTVDNRSDEMDPGINSHSISDHTQSNWNGVVGDISLQAYDKVRIGSVVLTPNVSERSVVIEAEIVNSSGIDQEVTLNVDVSGVNFSCDLSTLLSEEIVVQPGAKTVSYSCSLGRDAKLWDEFNPNTYSIGVDIEGDNIEDSREYLFGLREFKVDGTQFAINGRPLFLRGTLECAIFPKTGYPATDIEEWSRIMTVCQSFGLNHIRFHSWCPPEAAFIAADLAGVYLQVECASWANSSTTVGDSKPIDKYIYDESRRIVEEYGNHPSFCLMTYGNEPGGPNQNEFLSKFVNYWKERDSRHLYTAGAGWPLLDESDFHNTANSVRIQGWGQELNSIINSEPPSTDYDWSKAINASEKPIVSHEIGQWCVYPDFKEIVKYIGPLKAKNFELYQEKLIDRGLGEYQEQFLIASGKLQALCYKADIEAALRTKGFAGFQLLDLHDFPGQGTALVGVLSPFWEEKGYITAAEFNRFCGVTVPLIRVDKRVFRSDEKLHASVEVAHFGAEELSGVTPIWRVMDRGGAILKEGRLSKQSISIGNGVDLGVIDIELKEFTTPTQLELEVEIENSKNSWDFWVYPADREECGKSVRVVSELKRGDIDYLLAGGNLLLTTAKGSVKSGFGGEVGVGFSSIFWNTAWTGGQKPHTLGVLCDPEHPALDSFPTEFHSNWQWWDAMTHSDVIRLDRLDTDITPIVRVIDDWVTCRDLALIFEAKVGEGKIVISGVDLLTDVENREESKQLKYSLLKYMDSDKFTPKSKLSIEEILSIYR